MIDDKDVMIKCEAFLICVKIHPRSVKLCLKMAQLPAACGSGPHVECGCPLLENMSN